MISVVIPAYNEKANVTISLTKISNFLNDYNPDYEIIVVDDGSTDNTFELAESVKVANPKIKVVRNSHKGKGYAVRTGFLMSRGDFVLLSDADLSTPIEELKRLMVWTSDNGFDVAIASREGIGAMRKGEPGIRHVMGKAFNALVRLLVLPGIKDTQCGFKLFRGVVGRQLFSKSLLYGDSTKETQVPKVTAFDVEILFLAKKFGYKIKEVPVSWEYGKNTRVNKVRDSVINFLDVLKVRIYDMRGLYGSM